ncbi:MAG: PilN domain-containing protein [Thermodesulfobacteriota bacterium]
MTTSSTARIFQRTARLDFLDGLGIAIQQRSVAMAHLVKRLATVTLQQHRIVPLPGVDQPDARRAALAAAISAFVSEHSLDADRTYVSLPRASAVLSRLSLPAAAKGDLHQVIEFEIERLIPLSREEIFYDTVVREVAGKLDVLVISVPRRIVAEALAALELAEVRARSVVISPVAIFDYLRFCSRDEDEHVVTLIEEGGAVEFDYVARGTLVASHLVRGDEVASGGAISRLVSQEAVAAGGAPSAVKVYAWRAPGEPAGGGVVAEVLPPDLLASGAELLRCAEGTMSAPDGFFTAASPALVPAIGAALGAVREGSSGINLLPPEERRSVEEGAPVLTFLCAALLVLVTAVWLISAVVKDHRIAGQLERELAQLEPTMRTVNRNEDDAKALREKLQLLTQGDRRRISLLLKELTDVVPRDAYLTTFRFRSGKIELEGFAKSASDLVPLLERSPYFKNAQFTSPVTKVQDNQERFSLATEIEE